MKALGLANESAEVVFHSNSLTPPFAATDEEVDRSIKEASRVARQKVIICTNYLPTKKQPYGEVALSHTPQGLTKVVESSGLTIKSKEVVKIPEKPWAPSGLYLVIEAVKKAVKK